MSRFWNNKVKELVPYTPGEQPKDKKYIKLNTNESPYPPAPGVKKAISESDAGDLRLYPDPDVTELKKEIAAYYNLNEDQIFVGNGSDEVLAFSYMAFFNKNDNIYSPDITYSFSTVYSDLFDLNENLIPLEKNYEININARFCFGTI